MLPLDQGGVVDPNLKVYGTQNVYVADAGIIPLASAVSDIYSQLLTQHTS